MGLNLESQSPPDNKDSIQSSIEATDRALAALDKLNQQTVDEPPELQAELKAPVASQAGLNEAQRAYSEAWEVEAAKSTPQTDEQIRAKLKRQGLRPEPPTAEEVNAEELERLERLRAEAALGRQAVTGKRQSGRRSRRPAPGKGGDKEMPASARRFVDGQA